MYIAKINYITNINYMTCIMYLTKLILKLSKVIIAKIIL